MSEKKASSSAITHHNGKKQGKSTESMKSKIVHEAQVVEHKAADEAATTGVLLALAVALKVIQWGWEQFTISRIQRRLRKQQRRQRLATPA